MYEFLNKFLPLIQAVEAHKNCKLYTQFKVFCLERKTYFSNIAKNK